MENFDIRKIKAIIGLGNPGPKYYKNRHNIGFRILDQIAQKYSAPWEGTSLFDSSIIYLDLDGELFKSNKIYLIKPSTFMNSSGKACAFLVNKNIRSEEILVVHDELEKPFGNISVKFEGSAKGHNGLRSIIGVIGPAFWRLRFGIGRPEDKQDVGNYVLSNFSISEENQLQNLLEKTSDLILKQ